MHSDLVVFSIFFSDILLDFQESIWLVLPEYLMYFLAGIDAKQFWNISEEKYFASLRILNIFIKGFFNPFLIKGFVKPFLDIALTFFDSLFKWFLFKFVFFKKLAV